MSRHPRCSEGRVQAELSIPGGTKDKKTKGLDWFARVLILTWYWLSTYNQPTNVGLFSGRRYWLLFQKEMAYRYMSGFLDIKEQLGAEIVKDWDSTKRRQQNLHFDSSRDTLGLRMGASSQDIKSRGAVRAFVLRYQSNFKCVRNQISKGLNPEPYCLGPIILWHLSREKPFIKNKIEEFPLWPSGIGGVSADPSGLKPARWVKRILQCSGVGRKCPLNLIPGL